MSTRPEKDVDKSDDDDSDGDSDGDRMLELDERICGQVNMLASASQQLLEGDTQKQVRVDIVQFSESGYRSVTIYDILV